MKRPAKAAVSREKVFPPASALVVSGVAAQKVSPMRITAPAPSQKKPRGSMTRRTPWRTR